MFTHNYILRSATAFLLLIFVLGITPKKFLHSLFAVHIDNKVEKNNSKSYQLTDSGYTCDTDNIVAESPFETENFCVKAVLFAAFSPYTSQKKSLFFFPKIFSSLRGPPAII